ncbi:Os12g0205100, partial [Oryza sativa Japonica Group]
GHTTPSKAVLGEPRATPPPGHHSACECDISGAGKESRRGRWARRPSGIASCDAQGATRLEQRSAGLPSAVAEALVHYATPQLMRQEVRLVARAQPRRPHRPPRGGLRLDRRRAPPGHPPHRGRGLPRRVPHQAHRRRRAPRRRTSPRPCVPLNSTSTSGGVKKIFEPPAKF